MKITITQEFDTAEEAVAFIARSAGAVCLDPARDEEPRCVEPESFAATADGKEVKRTRKPRSDAGQVRGAYKPREDARTDTNAKPEGAGTPTGGAAERGEPAAGKADSTAVTSAVTPSAAPSGAALPLTLEAVRKTLGVLHKAPGKGMTACIAALQKFGVNRISDLPPAKYAEFAAYVQSQLPKAAA